jgi:DNA-binding transcriptional LysR family regulator
VLDVRRLRALRELADRGTIAAAADVLDLTPSAVSQQLAALEREVGRPLLEPAGRSVRLTPAARLLLEHADGLFAQLERLDAALAAQGSAGAAGEVRVAAFPTAIAGIVAPAVAPLARRAPRVRLAVREAEPPDALAGLARGDVDVVVAMEAPGAPQEGDPRMHRRDLAPDLLDAALPAGHPLSARPALRLAELRHDPWVAPLEGWSCDAVVLAACAAAGFTPRIDHRTTDWVAVLALVGAGLGVGLVPRLAQAVPPRGVAVRPLAGPAPCRHLFAACRRGAEEAPAVAAVLDALVAAAGDALGAEGRAA